MKKILMSLGLAGMLMLGLNVVAFAGNADRTTVVSETKEALPAPSTLTQTNATATTATVSWSAVTGAGLYQVEVANSGSSNYAIAGQTTGTSFKITGLASGTYYYVRVLAGNSADPQGYYKYLYNVATAPSVAKIASEMPYPSSQRYAYNMEKQSTTKGYRMKMYSYKSKKTTTKYFTSAYMSFDAKNNTVYKVTITPYTTIGTKKVYGSKSVVRYLLQQPQPKAKSHTSNSVTLGWTKMVGASNYSIYVKKPGSTKYTKVKTTTGTTYRYGGMSRNKSYDFYIVANKKVGSKTWKSTASNYYMVKIYG